MNVLPVSVVILTKNEERDLPRCLTSVDWSDDVHVFDSFSTDATMNIARQAGARITQRQFDDFAAQRNAALHGLAFKHPWVLLLDADEYLPMELREEIERFVAHAPPEVAAARMRRRDYLGETWLKHAQISPYFIRLVRPQRVRFERVVNEVLRVDGDIVDLRGAFDHYPFSKGMHHWIEKHNLYSSMEASLVLESRRGVNFSVWKALFSKDFNERRHHQKGLFYRLPFRPLIKWIYMMFLRGAFLDGRAGITYAFLQAMYEYMIVLKTRELTARARSSVE